MDAVLEVFAAFLAVWGAYSLLRCLREAILFPRRVRRSVHAAVLFSDAQAMLRAMGWADALSREGKISGKRLIIFTKDDIIDAEEAARLFGDDCRILYCKESDCERSGSDSRERT